MPFTEEYSSVRANIKKALFFSAYAMAIELKYIFTHVFQNVVVLFSVPSFCIDGRW
jgi:hypothetical protein